MKDKIISVRTALLTVIIACIINSFSFAQVVFPDSILVTLKKGHPRLLVNSIQEFQDIKARTATDDFIKQSVRNIIENADSVVSQPIISFVKQGKPGIDLRKIYFRTYFLSMAYRLTGDNKYAARLWADLDAASKFPDWNQELFIITGGMLQCFAIAYDWLYDVWTPEQRAYLKRQIIAKGLVQGLRYHDRRINKGEFNWVDIDHNWSAVCNGGLIMGALAIADEEPVLAEQVLKLALPRYIGVVKQFAPDGAYAEGPNYWWFAMAFGVTPTIASLETALATDFGLSKTEGFSRAGIFIESMGGANFRSFNYADAEPVITRYPELFWFANKFDQPDLTEVQKQYSLEQMKKGMWQQSPLDLLWYKPRGITGNNIRADNYFREAEIVSLRSKLNDNNAWFVAFKAGANGVNHGHLDIGSYVIDNQGVRWISDLGLQTYDVPGYFGDANMVKGGKRWTYYRTRAEGHNTLVINPELSEDQDVFAKTRIINFKSTPGKSFGIMDITEAYKGRAVSVKRGIALLKCNSVLVQDEIVSDKKMDLYWFAHTTAKITLSADKKTANMEIDGKKLVAQLLSPKKAFFEIMEAEPLPASPQPAQNDKNDGFKKLAIHIVGEIKTTIVVEYKENGKSGKQKVVPLSIW
ncbi:MAG: heparinase II/III family protein [Ferruginibacter sp.]|nr:heparinase II/III family protein [Ferruginibacter sp.]